MRLPLSVQLLLTFVGLLVGTTAVLTEWAYRSSRASLTADAQRTVSVIARNREQALTQLFHLRQQRAEGLLESLESLCSEPLDSGRLAWVDDCIGTMVDDFRKSENASGAVLTYRGRRLTRSGRAVGPPPVGVLTRVVRNKNETFDYVMKATRGDAILVTQFDGREVLEIFDRQTGVADAEVVLLDYEGNFLSPSAGGLRHLPAERVASFEESCRSGAEGIAEDYRGIMSFQSVRPVDALGSACVAVQIGQERALAPARKLRADLIARGGSFALIGAILSLVAAQWISRPVRRLASLARTLQTGRFDRPFPLSGPSEVRALGQAFNAMGNDLAELVAKEQAARRQAEAANRAKDEFLATVSHELRTPLTAVLGWAQMLRSERLSPDRARHGVEVIERSARAQARLIDDLLDVSRIVSNRLKIAREPVRLADVIEAALDTVRPEAASKGVRIETKLTDDAVVLGDPRRLEQVVWNLTWNAIKFTEPSGLVKVQLERVDRRVVLSVADTGIGISSAFLPHVFDWFRQADARSRSQSGLGLGLGIVRHIVQLHGGSVHAESRGVGHGATFIVSLPYHEAVQPVLPPLQPAPRPSAPRLNRLQSVRVLFVEDDDDTRELVRATLESAGATVDAFSNASEARKEMLADTPDLLISDIRMPEEDGYSLMRSLRGAGISTPAIALTAYARREDAEAARQAGFQLHVAKPVDADLLIDAVASVLETSTIH